MRKFYSDTIWAIAMLQIIFYHIILCFMMYIYCGFVY